MTIVNEEFEKFYGFYRALVTLTQDPEKFGRVKLWIPDVMPKISKYEPNAHLWARPANNPMGGRNKIDNENNYFTGSSYIPRVGSWVWVFFENGNLNRPYYWAAVDIEHSPVLPENQYGNHYENKWTVFKSNAGRCIVISDDGDDARVELTGKKRQLKNPPSGDVSSVFSIVDNQTTILLDERSGKEKILIKTYKGDFLNFDIENRMLHIYSYDDINIKTDSELNIIATEDINIKCEAKINIDSKDDINIRTEGDFNLDALGDINIKTSDQFNLDAEYLNIGSNEDINIRSNAQVQLQSKDDFNIKSTDGALGIQTEDYIGVKSNDDIFLTAGGTIIRHTGGPLLTNNGVHVGSADEAEDVDEIDFDIDSSDSRTGTKDSDDIITPIEELEIDDPIGNRDQEITEMSLVVTITGGASDMGGVADDMSGILDTSRSFGSSLATHMQNVNDYISGEIQTFNDLNAAALKTKVNTVLTNTENVINNASNTLVNFVDNASQTFSNVSSNIVNNANSYMNDIHKGFDQRNPNTKAVYDKLKIVSEYMDNLKSYASSGSDSANSFLKAYDNINRQITSVSVSDSIDDYSNAATEYADFLATSNAISSSFNTNLSVYDSEISSIKNSVENFLNTSESLNVLNKSTEVIINNVTEEPQRTDTLIYHQSILQDEMIYRMDIWKPQEIQSFTQMEDAYEILGIDIAVKDVDTLFNDLNIPNTIKRNMVYQLDGTLNNVNSLSDMAQIADEISKQSQNISSMGSIADEILELQTTVNDLMPHARQNHLSSIQNAVNGLNSTASQINNAISDSAADANNVLTTAETLKNDTESILNSSEYIDIQASRNTFSQYSIEYENLVVRNNELYLKKMKIEQDFENINKQRKAAAEKAGAAYIKADVTKNEEWLKVKKEIDEVIEKMSYL